MTSFPISLEIPVAWGEMDAYGHVNNIVYFRYFESARIAYFERLGLTEGPQRGGCGSILASTRCDFKIPLTYPDTVVASAGITRVGSKSFTMAYRVESQRHGAEAALGEGVLVYFDYGAGVSRALPDELRRAIAQLEGLPL